MRDWLNRTETVEGIYVALFAVSLVLGGLSEKYGTWWLLPLGIMVAIGGLYALTTDRY